MGNISVRIYGFLHKDILPDKIHYSRSALQVSKPVSTSYIKGLIINTFSCLICIYILSTNHFLFTCTEQLTTKYKYILYIHKSRAKLLTHLLPLALTYSQWSRGGRKVTGPVANRGMQAEKQSKDYYVAGQLL